MPTGYTCAVQDGSITEFKDFAMQCARAFGATITMRDDPMDKPIPDEFAPSSFYAEQLAEAKKRLAEVEAMTERDAATAAQLEFDKAHESWAERQKRAVLERQRYEAMLEKVQAWTPPTPDHEKFKSFMVDQINTSINCDCGDRSWDTEPVAKSAPDWKADAIEAALTDLSRYAEEHAKELKRTRSRTEWVRALRNSIA